MMRAASHSLMMAVNWAAEGPVKFNDREIRREANAYSFTKASAGTLRALEGSDLAGTSSQQGPHRAHVSFNRFSCEEEFTRRSIAIQD